MTSYKCSKEMHDTCSNSALCHLCDGVRLYKNPRQEKIDKMNQRNINKENKKKELFKTHLKGKKEGMAFEKDVQDKWNKKFSSSKKKTVAKPKLDFSSIKDNEEEDLIEEINEDTNPINISSLKKNRFERQEAKRQPNSGAMWHSKGDIKLDHALMECKERGTKNARGEKQITIPKEWLDKQELEAFEENRPFWYLPFRYKGSDDIYLVKPYDHELEIIHELREAQKKIKVLEEKLSQFKKGQ